MKHVSSSTTGLYMNAKSYVLRFLETIQQSRRSYNTYKTCNPGLQIKSGFANLYYESHKGILRPGVFMLQAIAVLTILNMVIKTVLPTRNYVAYARKLANPKWDELEKHSGPYDGCLAYIDTRYHHVFEETRETAIGKLRYQLLKMRGRRRSIELWHLVRADGTMRTNFNEIAHAVVKTDTWSKYLGDTTYQLKRMIRGASHSGTRRRKSGRVSSRGTRKGVGGRRIWVLGGGQVRRRRGTPMNKNVIIRRNSRRQGSHNSTNTAPTGLVPY